MFLHTCKKGSLSISPFSDLTFFIPSKAGLNTVSPIFFFCFYCIKSISKMRKKFPHTHIQMKPFEQFTKSDCRRVMMKTWGVVITENIYAR